eukprot:13749359-Alexandrium_andersonii.AAC.1
MQEHPSAARARNNQALADIWNEMTESCWAASYLRLRMIYQWSPATKGDQEYLEKPLKKMMEEN